MCCAACFEDNAAMDTWAGNVEVKMDRGIDPLRAHLGVREIRHVHEGDSKGLQGLGDKRYVFLSVGRGRGA
eukprot:5808063-Heterocapsa_arctica.AAC.1